MIVATAVASLGLFVIALSLSGVMKASAGVLTTTQNTVAIMRDASLDDTMREKAIQRASIKLLSDFASILARGGLALAASLVPVWLMDAAGLADAHAVFGFLSRWDVVLVASVVMVLGYLARRRLWPSN